MKDFSAGKSVKNTGIIKFGAPASNWNEALPIGNGKLGGMIFGKEYTELVQLNEDSVWFGGFVDRNNPSAKENLPRIRELIMAGRIAEAQELCALALSGTPDNQRHYEPLCNLYIMMAGKRKEISDYSRFLNLEEAVAGVSFKADGVEYRREYISSYPHDVMAIRLSADVPGSISFHAQLARGDASWDYSPFECQVYRHPGYYSYADECRTDGRDIEILTAACGGKGAVELCAGMKLVAEGGKTTVIGNSIMIDGADAATIYLAADTTFRETDPERNVKEKLEKAAKAGWKKLKEEHLADYRALYGRMSLELGASDKSEELERLFNFGRYLLIASSRPGSLPANLQGIWNNSMNPMWGSKYTININAEMNYWPAEICNLSECHLPLIDHIERMRANGRHTAEFMYGCRGFMAHHNTDIWGDTAPQDTSLSSTYWVLGAAWLCLHIWEHYSFTLDKAFLAEKFETMCEAARFVVDYLIEDGEYLVTCPTLSPENEYVLPNGEHGVICKGASMDNQIIRELFNALLRADEILCGAGEKELMADVKRVLGKIAPIRTGSDGRILEWNEEYKEIDPGHRHISHLFALHPGTQITPSTPELMEAAAKTLSHRLSHGGGHTGWSRAWIINMWARLGNGEEALENAKALFEKSTLPNLFDNHPPFQIDGNFGFTAGLIEMLVQSHEGFIRLLPALPGEWKDGSLTGVRARGGYTLNLEWKNGELNKCEIVSDTDSTVKLVYKNREAEIKLTAGEWFTVEVL